MVEILCPHCEGEIELDDDASGEFECPLCGGEFEWNIPAIPKQLKFAKSISVSQLVSHPIQWAGLVLSIVMLVILVTSLSASYYAASGDGEELKFKLTSFEETSGNSGRTDDVKYSEVIDALEGIKSLPTTDSSDEVEFQEYIDIFKRWKTAGLIANVLFVISLLACVVLLISRVIPIIHNGDFLPIPDGIYSIAQTGTKFLPFVISGLMLLGIILFMIIAPNNSSLYSEVNDKGFTFFTWMCLFLPMLYSIFSKYEVDLS